MEQDQDSDSSDDVAWSPVMGISPQCSPSHSHADLDGSPPGSPQSTMGVGRLGGMLPSGVDEYIRLAGSKSDVPDPGAEADSEVSGDFDEADYVSSGYVCVLCL